jgi:hypothetical protein
MKWLTSFNRVGDDRCGFHVTYAGNLPRMNVNVRKGCSAARTKCRSVEAERVSRPAGFPDCPSQGGWADGFSSRRRGVSSARVRRMRRVAARERPRSVDYSAAGGRGTRDKGSAAARRACLQRFARGDARPSARGHAPHEDRIGRLRARFDAPRSSALRRLSARVFAHRFSVPRRGPGFAPCGVRDRARMGVQTSRVRTGFKQYSARTGAPAFHPFLNIQDHGAPVTARRRARGGTFGLENSEPGPARKASGQPVWRHEVKSSQWPTKC